MRTTSNVLKKCPHLMTLVTGLISILFVSACSTTYKDAAPVLKVEELSMRTLMQLKACEEASLIDREAKINIGKVQLGAKRVNNRSNDSITKMDEWDFSKLVGW